MKKIIIYLTVILVIVDQAIKLLITNSLTSYTGIVVIKNFFYITYIENDGAAFNLFSGSRWLLVALGILVIIALVRSIIMDKKVTKLDVISYSLVLSGIIGNLIDRIINGKVIDYLDFYIYNYDAPIFNFADICIVIGAITIIYSLIIEDDINENNNSRSRIK
ncbi:MAG TPA: signal peptidase II [Bacilli bacterium]|nr:signal peptidase II [Bacilli bacterium]